MRRVLSLVTILSIVSTSLIANNKEYMIMLGAYKNINYAKDKIKDFPNTNSHIITKNKKNGINYYAVIDHIDSKEDAKELLKEVKIKEKSAFIIAKKSRAKRDLSGIDTPLTKALSSVQKQHYKEHIVSDLDIDKNITTIDNNTDIEDNQVTTIDAKEFSNVDDRDTSSTLSMKSSIIKALKNSYKVTSAKEKVIQAKEKVNEKLAAYMPKVDIYANGGGNYLKPYKKDEVKFWKSDESLVITQNIYAGAKHINEVKRERANLKAAIDKYRDKVEEETIKVIDAYLSLVYQKKAIKKADENMQNLKKILDIVKTKESSGAASKGDLNYIKSQVENASAALVKVKSKYKNALSFFEYFVGKVDESTIPDEEDYSFTLDSFDKIIKKTYDLNAKLQVSKYRLKAEKYNLRAQRSKFRPKIDLSITAKDKQSGYEGEPQEDRAIAMLQLSYNLYNGGKDKAIIQGTKSKIRELKYKLLDTQKGIKQNTQQLYENVSSSLETLSHTKEEVKANRKVIDSYWSAFKYGNQDLQALLLAQRALNRSELDEIKQKQTYINSYFKLLQQTGELLDKLGIESL
jgi:outer membrane protein TolC